MEINDFIDKLSSELDDFYVITYSEEKRYYTLDFISEKTTDCVIVTKRSLRNNKVALKRLDIVKLYINSKKRR